MVMEDGKPLSRDRYKPIKRKSHIQGEKALSATGHQDIQLASDWLLNHMDDPLLDKEIPREYVLYACAVGTLGDDMDSYWNSTLAKCGRNGAHSLLPHITLCSFFSCKDSKVELLCQAVQKAAESNVPSFPDTIDLELFSSPNFIGLFVKENQSQKLRKLTNDFAEAAEKLADCKVEPHKKELHVTMAYQFTANAYPQLEVMAKQLDLKAPARWELRLYSRDPRAAKSEVVRVLYPHSPRADDELELIVDDFVYVGNTDVTSNSDGWFQGTSHMTGCTGMFPGNYTEKAPESDTWTVHRVIPLTKPVGTHAAIQLDEKVPTSNVMEGADELHSVKHNTLAGVLEHNSSNHSYENLHKLKKEAGILPAMIKQPSVPSKPRKIIIVRHAERVDVTFGEQWLQYSFDTKGIYHRRNLNMPRRVPVRAGGKKDFKKDSPITEMGQFQARLTGEAITDAGINITQVYSSPALRCVQTADAIIRGMKAPESLKIRVEPGVFEWLAWCKGILPKWLTVAEMAAFGLNVDKTYTEFLKTSRLDLKESSDAYFKRCSMLGKHILEKYSDQGDILIVGHASTLDGISRPLQGLSSRPTKEFCKLVQSVPYCGCVTAEEYKEFGIWDLVAPPFPTLTHSPNSRFDWRNLQS
ncbi:Ubiquitin-associated and SH3 domain-containing protein B [Holothuria leucospilota]|uniref:Ubiquitin-associated and SH3 domain-containing protein B n=1 Tax=Holothuria leucospilota TaxID=206669 RepID=A0A9Q1H4Q8_HOLLE|nr:Ubiquitin-associated and SH3 domain-containing protein B [Holothuria leucospilota]